ncbi:MAG: hypothetical protein GY749_34720 [Desulfobacteraceae bacterium]|nr:hypothetical protein [Desulfobacteraceae bacterium]
MQSECRSRKSQIREKGYDQKYKQSGKKLILMGINFDTEKRNVADWKIE